MDTEKIIKEYTGLEGIKLLSDPKLQDYDFIVINTRHDELMIMDLDNIVYEEIEGKPYYWEGEPVIKYKKEEPKSKQTKSTRRIKKVEKEEKIEKTTDN